MEENLKRDVEIIVANKWYEIIEKERIRKFVNPENKNIFHVSEFMIGILLGIVIYHFWW